jgi:hypothetical protein
LRAHRTLDDVGVELDAAIVEEAGEAVPVPQSVANGLGGIGAAREPRELLFEEAFESVDERARSCLARGAARIDTERRGTLFMRASNFSRNRQER